MAAERWWLDLHERHGAPVHVFRLAGIYGPDRNALETLRRKQQGQGGGSEATQARRAAQRFTSRVHVADIVQCLEAGSCALVSWCRRRV